MRGKPIVLKELDNGCIVPISHKLKRVWSVFFHRLQVDTRMEE